MTASAHLAFVGMAGAGKSAVARRVAAALQLPLVDLDQAVSTAQGGISIAEVFARVGEERFREMETAALLDALGRSATVVIATGGGAVERPQNREALGAARVVWLTATDEVLIDRLTNSSVRRPLLEGDLEGNLRRLREHREPLYREVADLTVQVGFGDLANTVDQVLAAMLERWPDLQPTTPA